MANTANKSTPLGYIGLGVMGAAMARNLLKAGYRVTVHNRSRPKVDELVAVGARDGGSPAGVARESELILMCVPDTPDVEAVLFGPKGVIEGLKAGSVVIDLSTISPTATAEFARRLREKNAAMLDSPVSGGPKGAQDGTLSCMIGGDAETLARCMPVFEAIGKTFTHIGESGAGQACKACNQMVVLGNLMAASEALALARKLGIDPYKVRDALLGGSAQSFVLANHAKRLLDGTLQPGFRAAYLQKDIRLSQEAGRDAGAFMPVTAIGAQLLNALCNSGREGLDNAALGLLFEELSGAKR